MKARMVNNWEGLSEDEMRPLNSAGSRRVTSDFFFSFSFIEI